MFTTGLEGRQHPRYTLKNKVILTCRNFPCFYSHKYSTDVGIRRKHLKSHKTATHFIIYLQSLHDCPVFSYSSALVSGAQHRHMADEPLRALLLWCSKADKTQQLLFSLAYAARSGCSGHFINITFTLPNAYKHIYF